MKLAQWQRHNALMQEAGLEQAEAFAQAVNKLTSYDAATIVWNHDQCVEHGHPGALAGVVMESSGLGAMDDTHVILDSGYGREIELPKMSQAKGIFAEPYASWLLLFFER